MLKLYSSLLAGAGLLAGTPLSALAQDSNIPAPRAEGEGVSQETRIRIGLGPRFVPSWPGSDEHSIGPLVEFSRAGPGEQFAFEAPDESFGFDLYRSGGFSIGPSAGIQGKRESQDVGGALPDVDFTVELGGFAQLEASPNVRFRLEARQAVSGHDGFVSTASADYIWRDEDDTVVSIGPRLTLTDARFQRSYYGVSPADALASGLAEYDPGGGLQSVGAALGLLQQFTPEWGIFAYAKYDRLLGDPADSPVVAAYGSPDQYEGGLALTYTFGR